MKFFVQIQVIDGYRMITSCTQSREYAETHYGLGNYSAVYADDPHQVASEARRAGLTGPVTQD